MNPILTTLITALVVGGLRAAQLLFLDQHGIVQFPALSILLVIAVVAAFIVLLLVCRRSPAARRSSANTPLSPAAGYLCVFIGAFLLYDSITQALGGVRGGLELVSVLSGCAGALLFFFLFSMLNFRGNTAFLPLGVRAVSLVALIWPGTRIVSLFLQSKTALFVNLNSFSLLSCGALLFFLIAYCKEITNCSDDKSHRSFLFCGGLSVTFLLGSVVTKVLYLTVLRHRIGPVPLYSTVASTVLDALLLLWCFAVLCSLVHPAAFQKSALLQKLFVYPDSEEESAMALDSTQAEPPTAKPAQDDPANTDAAKGADTPPSDSSC